MGNFKSNLSSEPGSTADGERLLWLIKFLNRTQTSFADEIGSTFQHVTDIVHGRRRMGREFAEKVRQAFGVDLTWLLTGDGTPWGSLSPDGTTTTTAGIAEPLAEVEVETKKVYRCKVCWTLLDRAEEWCPHCQRRLLWPPGEPESPPKSGQ